MPNLLGINAVIILFLVSKTGYYTTTQRGRGNLKIEKYRHFNACRVREKGVGVKDPRKIKTY